MNRTFTGYFFLLFIFCWCNQEAFGQSWSGLDQNASGQVSVANGTGVSLARSPQGVPYVAYLEIPGHKASVKRFNGSSWELVGAANFTGANSNFTSLAIDAAGTPFVVYKDGDNANKASVKKFNGTNWVFVGNPGFSAGEVWSNRIALDAQGNPVVAFQEGADRRKVTVMKYNGTSWVLVGMPGITSDLLFAVSLALEANGTPVLAFSDGANGNKIVVKRFVGNSWVEVGTGGVSEGEAKNPSIALDANAKPFVAYQDRGANARLTRVRTFNGSSWVDVGGEAAYSGSGVYTSLKLDAAGNPTVAFSLESNYTAIVRKYANGAWFTLGTAGFSTGQAYNTDLILDSNDLPIVGFEHYTGGIAGKATVMRYVAPSLSITAQPQASAIDAGKNASFAVAASGTGITYQWQVSQDGGTSFTNVSNSQVYSGATSATLNLSKVPFSMNGYRYRVLVSNGAVEISNVAGLTVRMPPLGSNGIWQKVGASAVSAGEAEFISLALEAAGRPVVAYRDGANGAKATVRRFSGSAWMDVGTPGFSIGQASNTCLALDGVGVPYVAFSEGALDGKASVKKYNGSNWVDVGPAGFSSGLAFYTAYTHLKLEANGTPVVAYAEGGNNHKTVVKKFIGSSWMNIGSADFSVGPTYYTSLALDPYGYHYVAYTDMSRGYQVMVKRFTGSGWVDVGAPGVSAGWSYYPSLALDTNGTPYVAYQDLATKKVVVRTFRGGTWINVGNAGFSAGQADHVNLVLDAGGIPYVAFKDGGRGGAVTVMRCIGGSWEPVGNSNFIAGGSGVMSLALDELGAAYVAFLDAGNENKATVIRFATGPDMRTGPLEATSYCGGMPVQVPFTLSGPLDASHVLTAQLSDASGSFAAPVDIGSGTASPIAALIPDRVVPGNGYRIRVVSLTTELTGSDNGSDIRLAGLPAPAGMITGPPTICPEETGISYSVVPVPGAIDYTWSLPAGWRILSGQGSASIVVATTSSAGQISVRAGNECGQSGASALAVAVTYPVGGNVLAAGQDQSLCWGGMAQVLVGPALTRDNSTITYLWEYSTTGPSSGFAPAPGLNSARDYAPVAGLTARTWFRRRAMPGSCLAAATYSNAIQVHVAARLNPPAVPAASRCGQGTVALTANGTVADGSYRWYTRAGGGEAIAGATQATFTTPMLSTTTTYYVSAVSPQGCESERTAVTATVHPLPTANAGEHMSSCINQGAFILSGFSPAGGIWSGPGVTAAGVFNPAAAGLGSHTLTYEITLNGCSVSATRTMTVHPVPSLQLAAFTQSICSNNVSMVLSEGVPAGGAWSGPGVSNGVFNASLAGIGTHALVYTYSDAQGCQATASRDFRVVGCAYYKEDESVSRLVLYPNPAVSELKVSLLLKDSTPLTYRVFSRDGKLIMEKAFSRAEGDFSHVFDLRGYAKGLYLLQQITSSGVVNKSFVLQ